jgi:hypothetical protein
MYFNLFTFKELILRMRPIFNLKDHSNIIENFILDLKLRILKKIYFRHDQKKIDALVSLVCIQKLPKIKFMICSQNMVNYRKSN